jgi:chorismate synthase
MKPISTLMSPLKTVDLKTGGPAQAQSERSDVTAVPAMGVIAEAMMAIVLTQALLEKFGGDALSETKRNVESYLAHVRTRIQPHVEAQVQPQVPPLHAVERGPGGEGAAP